ncbi:MAG: serine/threonine protein kinase [Deltaproteobacteria bacterium]|jgi:hypothetical protein|nr:serine/threonine protein kinase [Deltaproteobacteria bacterium]MBW2531522.1 serine/threonine protein kinase [Deltaproteobacteria bacterium]
MIRSAATLDDRFRRNLRWRWILWLALVVFATGCGRGFVITTPAGFAELEDQDEYGYRAANAEGVVIAVRYEENVPFGDLGFWSGAVDAHLRRGGYVADEAIDVKSTDGIPGRQIRYHRKQSGREHVFWASVFVTEDVVVTVEAGGDRAYFEKMKKAVDGSIQSLTID